jgi:hypothetical protein
MINNLSFCHNVVGGSKLKNILNISLQYLKLRPLVACDLEAKQLGPQFYWSFSFGATLNLLHGHNNFVFVKARRKTQ